MSAAIYGIGQAVKGEKFDWGDFFINIAIGAVAGAIGWGVAATAEIALGKLALNLGARAMSKLVANVTARIGGKLGPILAKAAALISPALTATVSIGVSAVANAAGAVAGGVVANGMTLAIYPSQQVNWSNLGWAALIGGVIGGLSKVASGLAGVYRGYKGKADGFMIRMKPSTFRFLPKFFSIDKAQTKKELFCKIISHIGHSARKGGIGTTAGFSIDLFGNTVNQVISSGEAIPEAFNTATSLIYEQSLNSQGFFPTGFDSLAGIQDWSAQLDEIIKQWLKIED